MAAIFDTENNECSQEDYMAPVFAVNDDNSGVSKDLQSCTRVEYYFPCSCFVKLHHLYESVGIREGWAVLLTDHADR